MDNQIQKHQDNFGRFNHSVTQSGFDTWLDGYVPGVPDRKVSIYTEGCLLALITDLLIMKHSNCKNSLHDVMRSLYTNYYKKNKGYSYADYVKEVNACAGTDMQWLFDNYARQPKDLLGLLEETLNTVGIIVESTPCINLSESNYGFRLTEAPDKSLITAIHPDSPAAEKLVVNDQVISVNGYQVKNDANRWINYFTNEKIILGILRNSQLMQIELAPGEKIYYKNFHLVENPEATEEQKKQFNHWKNKR
jgi:predicted metalloprotease with PDZ domain